MSIAGSATASAATAGYFGPSYAVLSLFQQLLLDPKTPRRFLVEFEPYDPSVASPILLRYGQIGWEPKLSVPVLARIEEAVNYQSSIFSGEESIIGGSSSAFGAIKVLTPYTHEETDEDEGDEYETYYWDNRPVTVKMGSDAFSLADFGVVQRARTVEAVPAELSFEVKLRDPSLALKDRIQSSVYAGTGQIEGESDLKDQPRPICYGKRRNITARQIDRTNLVYQFHDRACEAVDAVYDGGIELTPHNGGLNDISDLALGSVWGWIPGVGEDSHYITDLSNGLWRLASDPEKAITGDVRGDNEGGYVDSLPTIVERILRQRASYVDADFDLSSLAQVGFLNQQTAGFFLQSGTISIEQAITSLLVDLLAFWHFDRSGLFRIGQLRSGLPSKEIKAARVYELHGLARSPLPHKRRNLNYAESETVQGENDLLGAVDPSHAAFVGQRFRTVTSFASAIEAARLGSLEQEIDTHLEDETEAQVEVDRQLALLSEDRRIWEVEVDRIQFLVDPGNRVRLYYPRWRFVNGRNAIVLGLTESSFTGKTTLRLWA